MNTDRIHLLANIIENQRPATTDSKAGYTQRCFIHLCGTPACLAGFAVALSFDDLTIDLRNVTKGSEDIWEHARVFLDLTMEQAIVLFNYQNPEPTPNQAAAVLRVLAATGEVHWDWVLPVQEVRA